MPSTVRASIRLRTRTTRNREAVAIALVLGHVVAAPANAEVKPGEVITAAQAERVRALLPPGIWERVVEGFAGLEMTIAHAGDYTPHAKYVEATAKFAFQAHRDEHGQLQGHVAGQPFPYSA